MNLPNWLTVGRIAFTPLLVWLPLQEDPGFRLAAFVLFLAVAVTDYYDGMLARTMGLVTDLGKMLDPLADKLLLLGTFVPMFWMQAPTADPLLRWVAGPAAARNVLSHYPFVLSFGGTDVRVPLPWWVVLIVLGREVAMTVFRQLAHRRGTVIAAIFAAKLKTTFQLIWIGAAYFWFFVATVDRLDVRDHAGWDYLTNATGLIGAIAMVASVALTLYSLTVYVVRYGGVLAGGATPRDGRA
ncbi:MAG TPA: CDP-alcohol phosphatidyltransferase family protein [Gemmatimonadaceae bacterium]|nr:CDP-alcohol phosphatidyltransferase family protein [Gemmatimonadaceae bacterium]